VLITEPGSAANNPAQKIQNVAFAVKMVRVLSGSNFAPLKTRGNSFDQFWLPNRNFFDQALERTDKNLWEYLC